MTRVWRRPRALVLGAAMLGAVGLAGAQGVSRWIDRTPLPPLVVATGDEVRDRSGQLLRAYTVDDGLWRLALSRDAVDPGFVDLLLAYEDKRFYRHSGVDWRAALRAAGQAVASGRVVSGASTLTMQVARLLEDGPTGQLQGKLRQVRLALALERHLDKAQILDLYLHLAPYGGNVEGLRAASLTWLGKEPGRLTPAEAALLVALPQSPRARRPDRNGDAARAPRDRVLARGVQAGVLTAEDARAARRDPLPALRRAMPQLAPHLANRAVARGPGRHDLTIDAGLQRKLQRLVADHAAGLGAQVSVAVVLADHASGAILASVGSPRYAETTRRGFVDMTQAVRSPGSTLKPLVYGLAFDRGLAHPQTLILDAPVDFGGYAPQNFDGLYRGEVTAADALKLSLNIPVVRLTEALGPANVMQALRRAGADPQVPGDSPGLAISLGGLGLTLTELTQVYATIARGGAAVPLHWDRNQHPPAQDTRVLDRASAWHLGHTLAQLMPPPGAGRPGAVAWKTGTSYGHRDAWALGWDGRHVAGVWIGRPDGTPVPGAFGGDLAAPLLFKALARARSQPAPLPPPPPETLLVPRADLHPHLQRFGPEAQAEPLQIAFPPDGARLADPSLGVPVKLRGGTPPFTLLADGAVVATDQRRPSFTVDLPGPGFAALTVIDARGQSDQSHIALD